MLVILALSRGEFDFWTPMGSIGPQKSGRVDRDPDALHRGAGRARGCELMSATEQGFFRLWEYLYESNLV